MARQASCAGREARSHRRPQGFPSAPELCFTHRVTPPPPTPAPPRRGLVITGLIVGTLLTLSPLFGLLGTVVGMMKAFNAIGVEGAGDTGQLSVGIGEVLVSTAVGLALFVPGVILLTISIIHY